MNDTHVNNVSITSIYVFIIHSFQFDAKSKKICEWRFASANEGQMLYLFTKMGLKNGTQNASFHFKSKCNLQYMILDTPQTPW